MMSGLVRSVQSICEIIWTSSINGLDKMLPAEKRSEISAKLQNFAVNNPKLAAFLATQLVFTGIPIILFLIFSISVLLFSLITALLVAVVAAVSFTLFMTGLALLFLVPTIFVATFTSSFLFLSGLSGYLILNWFSKKDEAPTSDRKTIAGRAHDFSGGRINQLTQGVSAKQDRAQSAASKVTDSGSDGSEGLANGKSTERGPQKVTEDLRDGANAQSADLPEQNPVPKETVGGAVGT